MAEAKFRTFDANWLPSSSLEMSGKGTLHVNPVPTQSSGMVHPDPDSSFDALFGSSAIDVDDALVLTTGGA